MSKKHWGRLLIVLFLLAALPGIDDAPPEAAAKEDAAPQAAGRTGDTRKG